METSQISSTSPPVSLLQRTSSSTLGKDDFLKLLMTQMSHQDPLSPMDSNEMMSQMSQLGQVEQLTNLNTAIQQSLQNDAVYQQSLQNQLAANMIGKRVRGTGDTIKVEAEATQSLGYRFESTISSGNVEIYDSNGKLVRTLALSTQASGDHTISWDGKDESGVAVTAGTYTVKVTGTDANGDSVSGTPSNWYRIDGVTYRNGTAYLTSGTKEIAFADIREIKEASTTLLKQLGLAGLSK